LIAEAEGFAVDKKAVLAGIVFDGKIVAPGEELLFHQVDHGGLTDLLLYQQRQASRDTACEEKSVVIPMAVKRASAAISARVGQRDLVLEITEFPKSP
jgi:hypothetical protein